MLLRNIVQKSGNFRLIQNLACSCVARSSSSATTGDSELKVAENQDEPTAAQLRNVPIITSRKLDFMSKPHYEEPRQAWVENLDTISEEKLGLVDLHPQIFATYPRIDTIGANLKWQTTYSVIDWTFERSRAEMPGGGRKPWPQKGMGRARQGSIRAPHFIRGGKAHGARGPETHFYMLPFPMRLKGLTSTLSVKLAQDDLKIVDNLEIPTEDKQFIEDLVEERNWGPSVLFVDDTDYMPRNISMATADIKHVNLMPAYGLNVHSMLKHVTLVLTLSALERIEERLLFHMNRNNYDAERRFKPPSYYDRGYVYA